MNKSTLAWLVIVASTTVACGGELEPEHSRRNLAYNESGAAKSNSAKSDSAKSNAASGAEGVNDTEAETLEGAPCSEAYDTLDCTLADGREGVLICDSNDSDELTWSECIGTQPTPTGSSTPLVLSFDSAPVVFTHPAGNFDLAGHAASFDTDWVAAATPWLAVDLDGNGRIDDGRELFGSMTRLPDGRRADNGFTALAALDTNGDGRITAEDPAFSKLVLWRDLDQDRASSPRELQSAEEAGLIAIELGYRVEARCVGTACEMERASFQFRGAHGATQTGSVIDVHFSH